MLAVEWGTGQVFWSILWFFLFFMWIWLVISIFADIIRSDDMGGWAKALWSIFVIFLPFLGVFMYLIVRGGSMSQRAVRDAEAQKQATDAYIRSVAGTASPADQLSQLAALHDAGKIDDAEYERMKAQIIV